MVEVVAGAIILAITFAGLLATFVAVRKYVKRANKRLISTDLASQTLNDLYRAVRADQWDAGDPGGPHPLETTTPGTVNDYTIDNQSYRGNSYSVSATPGDYRRVTVIINYP